MSNCTNNESESQQQQPLIDTTTTTTATTTTITSVNDLEKTALTASSVTNTQCSEEGIIFKNYEDQQQRTQKRCDYNEHPGVSNNEDLGTQISADALTAIKSKIQTTNNDGPMTKPGDDSNDDQESSRLSTGNINCVPVGPIQQQQSAATSNASELVSHTENGSPFIGPDALVMTHLPNVSSEPTFGSQTMRTNQQQQKIAKFHETSGSVRQAKMPSTSSGAKIKPYTGSVSASISPSMIRKCSDSAASLPRRVSFPKSDNELVTGYLEPANPWEHAYLVKCTSEVSEPYVKSCLKHNTKPLKIVLDHLRSVDLNMLTRQPLLSLKTIKLTSGDCEALEEVFKRMKYKTVDLSSCELDESSICALFDIIEYYEAAIELDISFNASGMTQRGWSFCISMVSHSQSLQVLNAQGNIISKINAKELGSALSTSNLHTLKLEHCGLRGLPLSGLCFELWRNQVLKELWLAHNDLDCKDADSIADLLKVNHYLEFIDISNNDIRDEGLRRIVAALIVQSNELDKRTTMMQRTTAIDDDGSWSPEEESPPPVTIDVAAKRNVDDDDGTNESSASASSKRGREPEEAMVEVGRSSRSDYDKQVNCDKTRGGNSTLASTTVNEISTVISSLAGVEAFSSGGASAEEKDADDDTEDTVKSSTAVKILSQSSGQSMLDKLLSMNSDSGSGSGSSDDGASNISTETIAACCSEDTSVISDEIFEAVLKSSAGTTNATDSPCKNAKAPANADKMSLPRYVSEAREANDVQPTAEQSEYGDLFTGDTMSLSEVSPRDGNISGNNKIGVDPAMDMGISNNNNNNNNNSNSNGNGNGNGNNVPSGNDNNNDLSNSNSNGTESTTETESGNSNFHSLIHDESTLQSSGIFEVTAEESDCLVASGGSSDKRECSINESSSVSMTSSASHVVLLQSQQHNQPTKAVDMNKNTKPTEDYDDTHSTDSAFESASEGDISRHLPEEFTRLSASLESTRLDDMSSKDIAIETATIATESTECLLGVDAASTPTSSTMPTTPPSHIELKNIVGGSESHSFGVGDSEMQAGGDGKVAASPPSVCVQPKVTIAEETFITRPHKRDSFPSPNPTPPPPSTSPGGVSFKMHRTDSTCSLITQSTRNRSHSSDSLCSDNNDDGSTSSDLNFSASSQLNEKLTKNDTLTRQQRQLDPLNAATARTPNGLKALAVWNNNLGKESGIYIANLLAETVSLELLNIGKNVLSNEFVTLIKDSLMRNTTLTTLGLQSAHLSAKGIETLSSILTFGGNSTLQRIDIRDNKLEIESLATLAEVLKSNTTVTQIDIDDEPKRLSVGSDAHLDYTRVLENVRSMCSRNEKAQAQALAEKSSAGVGSGGGANKRRSGYYVGSRKISLTCYSRSPLIDSTATAGGSESSQLLSLSSSAAKPTTTTITTGTGSVSNGKLEVKRKTGARLRSPMPSPPAVSPSSSPNRSRFQVFRVNEVSPLTSPLAQTPPPHPPNASTAIVESGIKSNTSSCCISNTAVYCHPSMSSSSISSSGTAVASSTSLPTSSSLPSMATITSSTQTVKRLSMSPRSRFHVSKIVEDLRVPLAKRPMPPITPPLNPPPTPMLKSAPKILTQSATDSDPHVNDTTTHGLTAREKFCTNPKGASGLLPVGSLLSPSPSPSTSSSSPSPSPSPSPSSSTSSSSSSTSPASVSTSSPSSCSSSNVSSSPGNGGLSVESRGEVNSSRNSSRNDDDNPDSYGENSLSISEPSEQATLVGVRCPIVVFGDNDITLTKDTASNLLTGNAAQKAEESKQQQLQPKLQSEPQTAPTRKLSWVANPSSVDRLLTLFQTPGAIFQRASSPDMKSVNSTSENAARSRSPSPAQQRQRQQQQQQQHPQQQHQNLEQLESLRHNVNVKANGNSNNSQNEDSVTSFASASGGHQLEASPFWLDVTSKQLREFGKQVLRPYLLFGNEPKATEEPAEASGTSDELMNESDRKDIDDNVTNAEQQQQQQQQLPICDGIPTEMKREIKENISPDHAINEETLPNLQKLSGDSDGLKIDEMTLDETDALQEKSEKLEDCLPMANETHGVSASTPVSTAATSTSSLDG